MKKHLFLMLFLSINGYLFAQSGPVSRDENVQILAQAGPTNWDDNISIVYKNNLKVIVEAYPTALLLEIEKYRLDFLLKVALGRFRKVADDVNDEDAVALKYTIRKEIESISYKATQPTNKAFGFIDDEVVRIKELQDSLTISIVYEKLPDYIKLSGSSGYNRKVINRIDFHFIANRLSDIESLGFDILHNDVMSSASIVIKGVTEEKLLKDPTMGISMFRTPGNKGMYWINRKTKVETVNIDFSSGWIRNSMSPSIGAKYILDKGYYGMGIGFDNFFFFENNFENKLSVKSAGFVNLNFRINKLDVTDRAGVFDKYKNVASISVGYLVYDKANYFNKNTFRTSLTLPVFRHISVEPELYFNGFFNNFYPGVRLKVN